MLPPRNVHINCSVCTLRCLTRGLSTQRVLLVSRRGRTRCNWHLHGLHQHRPPAPMAAPTYSVSVSVSVSGSLSYFAFRCGDVDLIEHFARLSCVPFCAYFNLLQTGIEIEICLFAIEIIATVDSRCRSLALKTICQSASLPQAANLLLLVSCSVFFIIFIVVFFLCRFSFSFCSLCKLISSIAGKKLHKLALEVFALSLCKVRYSIQWPLKSQYRIMYTL